MSSSNGKSALRRNGKRPCAVRPRQDLLRRIRPVAVTVLGLLLLVALTVTVLAQGDAGRIDYFERHDPVATASVDAGTALEDTGLPENLRAVVGLDDEADIDSFEQDQPAVSEADGSYDFQDYGYVPPKDADELYAAGDLAIYTITYAGDDGSVVETAYRIYGSLEGDDPTWYACDEDGTITGEVVDVPVSWEGDYNADEPGTYTLTASFSGYTYAEAHPYAVVTVGAASTSTSNPGISTLAGSTSDNPYEPGQDEYYDYIWDGILDEFEWASADDMGDNVSAAWTGNTSRPTQTVTITSSYDPSRSVTGYAVTNGAQLRWCIENHVSFQLQNDIDLGGAAWTSIVQSSAAGQGWTGSDLTILDFGNHTIYNMYVTGQYSSLLGTASNRNLYVENLNLRNFKVGADGNSNTRLAALCNSTGYMTIYNVHLYDGVVQGGNYVAGFINGDNGDVLNHYDDVAMVADTNPATTVENVGLERVHVYSAGHGAGFATNTWGLGIENCYTLDCTVVVPSGHSGGFVSCIRGLKANNCFTNAEVYGEDMTGVFLGMMHVGTYLVENCVAFGSIEGTEDIGGFVASTEPSNTAGYIDATFRNCYSTSIVGMQNGGSYMGGFMGTIYSSDMRGSTFNWSYTNITFENCYAAGEVGGVDTAVDADRDTHTTVGGFIGTIVDVPGSQSRPSSVSFTNCYYDKQTTAMREWITGEYLGDEDGVNANASGVTGVLTTETDKSGAGLTSGVGATGFTGFTNNSEWSFVSNGDDSYYPQVSSLANASADSWITGEQAALARAASAASAATVFLETWETDFDDESLPYTTYDTVRDMTLSFTATSDTSESSVSWEGDGAQSTLYGDTSNPILTVSQDGEGVWRVSVGSIGISWLEVAATDSGQVAYRSIRLIPTMALDAGEDSEVEPGSYYDHADDVWVAYSTAARLAADGEDIELGIYPDQVNSNSSWSAIQEDIEPGQGNLGSASESYLVAGNDKFSDATTEDIASGSTFARVDITQIQGVKNGAIVDMSEDVDVDDAENADKWNALSLFYLKDQGVYEITYYWELGDGRYLSDDKNVTIVVTSIPIEKTLVGLSEDNASEYSFRFASVRVEWDEQSQTWVEAPSPGSESYSERMTITVSGTEPTKTSSINFDFDDVELEPGPHYFKVYEIEEDISGVSYDKGYYIVEFYVSEEDGTVSSLTVLRYTSDGLQDADFEWEGDADDVLYFSNSVTADIDLKKVGAGGDSEPLEGAGFYLYYTVNTVDADSDPSAATAVKYYYQRVGDGGGGYTVNWINENSITEDNKPTELVSGSDGMISVEDLRMDTTYYLEEVEAPDGYFMLDAEVRIWWDASGTLHMQLAGESEDLEQNEEGVFLVVNTPQGVISGLAWVDADNDGIRETGSGGDDEFVDASFSNSGRATVGGDDIPASAEGLFDIDGLVATLMRQDGNGWTEVTDTSDDVVQVTLASAGSGESTYTLDANGTTYTVTARSEDGWGYYFGGLPAGTYAVRFTTGDFALGAYGVSPQDEGGDDSIDSDASGRYVESVGGSESATQGSGWLSSTIVETITIPESTGQGHEAYLSLHNDTGLVPRLGSITIDKSDEDGNSLEGVTFTLELLMSGDDWDNSNAVVTVAEDQATDNDGTLSFENLWPGTYRLTETGSASGNSLLVEPVEIVIPFSSLQSGDTAPSYIFENTNYWLDLVYDITNGSIFALPRAGVNIPWWVWLIIGALLVAISGAIVAKLRMGPRKKRLAQLRDSIGVKS